MTWTIDGHDVSHYQSSIDWQVVRDTYDWAATKMTQRDNYVDPTFDGNRTEMAKPGLRARGLYHWQSPSLEASIDRQVQRILKTSGGFELGEFFMSDSEQSGITEPETFDLLS